MVAYAFEGLQTVARAAPEACVEAYVGDVQSTAGAARRRAVGVLTRVSKVMREAIEEEFCCVI
eukprot:7165414-Lingulodinium_polyedra.AAC.1